MPKRFGPQHIKNGYAAMGGNLHRPRYPSARTRSVSDSIAAARAAASKEQRLKASRKK